MKQYTTADVVMEMLENRTNRNQLPDMLNHAEDVLLNKNFFFNIEPP
jgi:hypothetical protein